LPGVLPNKSLNTNTPSPDCTSSASASALRTLWSVSTSRATENQRTAIGRSGNTLQAVASSASPIPSWVMIRTPTAIWSRPPRSGRGAHAHRPRIVVDSRAVTDARHRSQQRVAGRYQRGRACFALGQKVAEDNGWPFAWRLVEAEGVAHSSAGMFEHAECARALFGGER